MGKFIWPSTCSAFGCGSGSWPAGRLLPTSLYEAIALDEAKRKLPLYIPARASESDLHLFSH